MLMIDDLFKARKITTKTRAKAIASHLGLGEAFTEAEAQSLLEVDALMSANKIRLVEEAIERYRKGERVGGKSRTVADYTSQNVDGALIKTEEERRQDKMRQIDKTAEQSAGITVVARNIREAQYIATGNFQTPEIRNTVQQSELLVFAAITGNIGWESELGNFLSGFESDLVLPEARDIRKAT